MSTAQPVSSLSVMKLIYVGYSYGTYILSHIYSFVTKPTNVASVYDTNEFSGIFNYLSSYNHFTDMILNITKA